MQRTGWPAVHVYVRCHRWIPFWRPVYPLSNLSVDYVIDCTLDGSGVDVLSRCCATARWFRAKPPRRRANIVRVTCR